MSTFQKNLQLLQFHWKIFFNCAHRRPYYNINFVYKNWKNVLEDWKVLDLMGENDIFI